jgi:hypothetical protein
MDLIAAVMSRGIVKKENISSEKLEVNPTAQVKVTIRRRWIKATNFLIE